jgi:hypothetical protein
MAKELVFKRLVPSSAWRLYELAFTRDGDAVCADSGLPSVVIDNLDYRIFLADMKMLVTKRCASQLQAPVLEKLRKNDSGSYRKGACEVLADVATDEVKKLCE